MSESSILHSYDRKRKLVDNKISKSISKDEAISVYKVYVKEANESHVRRQVNVSSAKNSNRSSDVPVINSTGNAMNISDKSVAVLKKTKVSEINIKDAKNLPVTYSQPVDVNSSAGPRLIDKDDPRSRLHFVKYLKREGKTVKIWECGICSKEFRHQYTLMRHLPTHTDERNFKCDACGKAFRQLSTLSQHKAIHSDARPYVCEFCKKTFNRVSTLISHRKTHSENKPHKCHLCGKGFHQKGNLRNHVFTHTNERPYKCEQCGKGFNQMSNLVCHKVKAHAHVEKMQYSCGICGKEFPRRFALRSHEEYKHGIKYRNSLASSSSTLPPASKRKKNITIVELSNEEEDEDDDDDEETVEATINSQIKNSNGGYSMESVIVDKIDTKAMENTLLQGQTPFALFKPAKGIPVLVKVSPAGLNQHILTAANPEDLRLTEKFPGEISESDLDSKAVQVKVPVVATVIQSIDDNGNTSFTIEPPGSDDDQVENILTPLDEFYQDSLGESDHPSEPSRSSSMDDCNELLELAAQGGIQFVRAIQDGRYEVMSNSEARNLMSQNPHDVTLLDGPDTGAINVMNVRIGINENNAIIGHGDDNQIMVLDGGVSQKPSSMDGIEIMGDKDIRILDMKNMDDRYVDNVSFFPAKYDEMINYNPTKNSITDLEQSHEDNLLVHQDFSSIHQNLMDMPQQSPSMLPLLSKNESSLPMLNEAFSYLKPSSNGRAYSDNDFSLLDEDFVMSSMTMYDSKVKIPEFDDITEPNILSMSQTYYHQAPAKRNTDGSKVILPSYNEMKALGPKYQEFEASSQYHDIKIFNNYDQFLRPVNGFCNGGTGGSGFNDLSMIEQGRRDIISEKKSDLQEDVLVKVPSLSRNSPPTSFTNPDDVDPRSLEDKDNFFQESELGDSDYLHFETGNIDSPTCQTNRSFALDGLPDLN